MRCAWLLLFALDFCLCLQNILYPHGQIVTRRNINNLPIGHYNLLQNCRYSIHRQNSLTTLHHGNHKSDDKDYDKLINNVTTSNYYLQNDSSPKMFSRQSIQSLNLKSLPSFPRIMVLAIGVSFLIPVLLRRRITKTDFVTFVLTTASLSVFDKFRSVFKPWVRKFKSFKDNVLKHTTPITKSYFFKNENAADRVTILGVWINILLSIIKFAGGILFNSAVLVADAGHSLSDLLSDFITLWAVQISRIPADEDHPYGHGKFESIGSLFLSLTLVATGVSVGTWSYERMHFVLAAQRLATSAAATSSAATAVAVQIPTWPALLLAAISIGSKEWLYRVTKRVGVLLNSQIVIANAWHHRSDAFSSVLSLFSIAVAIALPKLVFMDSAAGILIAGMISLSGLEILFESIKSLSDTSDRALADSIKALALSVDDGVLGVNKIRTRNVGSSSIVDLTILTDTKITASAAQSLSERVRWKLLDAFPQVVDALVRTHSTSTPCPLLSQSLKPSIDIEKEVKTLIMTQKDVINIQDIKRVNIYYINAAIVTVEVVLRLKEEISQDNGITLKDAQYISDTVTNLIKTNIQDILQVDVLIDLSGKSVEIETAESIASLK